MRNSPVRDGHPAHDRDSVQNSSPEQDNGTFMDHDLGDCHCDSSDADRSRRGFLRLGAFGTAGLALAGSPAMAGPFTKEDFANHLVPADKKLSAEWLASLTRRGEPETFEGEQLKYVGMPIGGSGCGQLYLGGDGKLWHWDIFKSNYRREPDHA
ncbi:hypothetical protein [Aporhodopirellula aestuarii]|uniref:Twin-arginine translocation pathway signal n=1 Tax=Aporhodopirellula aestuarii TaxID=2950107 RepID=A0ABT0UEI4_9BACT|nr:hypothetical protein [Aporhodopirellula aestuarii]MCM2375284.1 hypothetical protein [Aporhodopirellula aestuarii]